MTKEPTKLNLSELIGGGYDDIWACRKRYRVIKGSRGSKKSKTMAIQRIVRLIQYPEANYLCVRRYGLSLRDSIYADTVWAIHRLQLDAYFTCKVSPLEIVYNPTGQKILFRGLDDGLKITSITVAKGVLNYVDIEEAYEISELDFNKLEMSIRGEIPDGYFKQITLIFNPWSANSWLKSRFFDDPDDNTFTATTTYRCNEWLDDSDINIFENMKISNPRRYRVEGDGDWGISEGLIYTNTKLEEFNPDDLRGSTIAVNGLDFGYTDPNAFVCTMIDDTNKIVYIYDEWYQREVTNPEIARAIIEMGQGGIEVVADCAEPKSIAEIRNEGIKISKSPKGRDSRRSGIKRLQEYMIIVHPRCVNVWNEITSYAWHKDRLGNLTDEPEHEYSHCMDALRYALTKIKRRKYFSFD